MKTKPLLIILLMLLVNRGVFAQDDKCTRQVGPYYVQLTAFSATAQYCQSIPSVGPVTFTLDYADPEVRGMKTEVRLIRVKSWPEALEDKNDKTAPTLLHLPPQTYPTGLVIVEHAFTEPGYYVELVTLEGSGHQRYVLRFPFRIGLKWGAETDWRQLGKLGAYIALFALAFGTAYYFLMYRKRRGKTRPS